MKKKNKKRMRIAFDRGWNMMRTIMEAEITRHMNGSTRSINPKYLLKKLEEWKDREATMQPISDIIEKHKDVEFKSSIKEFDEEYDERLSYLKEGKRGW